MTNFVDSKGNELKIGDYVKSSQGGNKIRIFSIEDRGAGDCIGLKSNVFITHNNTVWLNYESMKTSYWLKCK